MGQKHAVQNRLVNQWTYVDILGRFQIFKNQHNQLAQRHVVRVDPKIDENDYITAYHQRYLPSKPIVNAFDAQFSKQGRGMCQNSSTITVFTEYIPHRLSGVKRLNHGQGMYVLSEALAGFAQLFGRVGPFQVHENLIGFNQQGEVRVWYNPNFAENSVDNDRIILMSTVNPYDFDRKFSQNQQHDMVQDTINAIARYTQFHPNFLAQAQQLKKLSFGEARRIIANEIARKAYYVPDHLFLGDKNDIIKKSGVQLKHKHVYNPNKPQKGEKYPYFVDGQHQQSGQNVHYLQGQPPYPTYGYDDQSQTSQSSDAYNGQGYYNMNGQNYRIVGTRQFQGNEVNEQAIIDEIMRTNANTAQYQPQQPYHYDQPYIHTQSGVQHQTAYDRSETSSQYHRRHPRYEEGHIVINDDVQHERRSKNQLLYLNQQQQVPQQQKETVRVFSIGEDGRLVEEAQHYGQYQSQNQYQSQYPNQVTSQYHPQQVTSQYHPQPRYTPTPSHPQSTQPHYQTRVTNPSPYSQVYPTRQVPTTSHSFNTAYSPNQSHLLPPQPAVHLSQYQHDPSSLPSPTHRHKIFQPVSSYHQHHQDLVREGPQVDQRVF